MKNEFDQRIKTIMQELLDLKTASEYSSIRTSNITSSGTITTGLYRVTYDNRGESIISMFYNGQPGFCFLYPRTPSGNSQVVEVRATRWNNTTQSYDTYTNKLVVVSNVPVVSITRIS